MAACSDDRLVGRAVYRIFSCQRHALSNWIHERDLATDMKRTSNASSAALGSKTGRVVLVPQTERMNANGGRSALTRKCGYGCKGSEVRLCYAELRVATGAKPSPSWLAPDVNDGRKKVRRSGLHKESVERALRSFCDLKRGGAPT